MGAELRQKTINKVGKVDKEIIAPSATVDSSGDKSHSTDINDILDAPGVLRPWISFARCIPSIIPIPFTSVDLTLTVVFFLILVALRIVIAPLMYEYWEWPHNQKESSEAVGSVVSMFHAGVLLPGLLLCLLTQPFHPSATMKSSPQWWQDASTALIHLCTGYMIQDSVMTFLVERYKPDQGIMLSTSDYLFLGHHFATALYMISTLLTGAGHQSAMILMYTGEFTNPVFNSFQMSSNALRLECCGATKETHEVVGIMFSILYVFFRLFVGPAEGLYITYDLLFTSDGRKNVHLAVSFLWLFMMWAVLLGSLPWAVDAVNIIKAYVSHEPISDVEPATATFESDLPPLTSLL